MNDLETAKMVYLARIRETEKQLQTLIEKLRFINELEEEIEKDQRDARRIRKLASNVYSAAKSVMNETIEKATDYAIGKGGDETCTH